MKYSWSAVSRVRFYFGDLWRKFDCLGILWKL